MSVFISTSVFSLLKVSRYTVSHFFIRNAARQPVKVLQEEELSNKYRTTSGNYTPHRIPKEEEVEEKVPVKTKPVLPSGFPRFDKMGQDDRVLSVFIGNTSSKKKRLESGMIMLEGERLIAEALKAKLIPKAVFFSSYKAVAELPFQSCTFVFQKVTYKRIRRWSKLVTPPGAIGFFKLPDLSKMATDLSLPITLVCDNVRDPGNLGSILRVAAGVGCRKVLLTAGCADIWESKTLRSAAGAHFHVPLEADLTWEDIHKNLGSESRIYLADNATTSYDTFVDNLQPQNLILSSRAVNHLPIIPYYNEDFHNAKDLYLIVGGETMGISEEVLRLATSHRFIRLHIPMENNVESLNVGTAVGVLIYEMKRQLVSHRVPLHEPAETAVIPSFQ